MYLEQFIVYMMKHTDKTRDEINSMTVTDATEFVKNEFDKNLIISLEKDY